MAGLIAQKRDCGFIYEAEALKLLNFDAFCVENGFDDGRLSMELVAAWAAQRDTEGKNARNARVSTVRQLAIYMRGLGIDACIPPQDASSRAPVPHILPPDELRAFFRSADASAPLRRFIPLWHAYRVLFRVLHCCGMRVSEACDPKTERVDLESGTLALLHSKGDKDRLARMDGSLRKLCADYDSCIGGIHPGRAWLFPNHAGTGKTNVDRKFNEFWASTSYAPTVGKKPAVHSLRHTFVVDKMHQWMIDKVESNEMLAYLSMCLGHAPAVETRYHHHQTLASFEIARGLDQSSENAVPEVEPFEEYWEAAFLFHDL
jgi:integrase